MITELLIRDAVPKDAKALAALDAECFNVPWTEESIRHDIEFGDNMEVLIAETSNKIIAYLEALTIADECDIRRVAVHPDFRKLRIASILMQALVHVTDGAGVQSHTLEVRESNEPAINLYKKFGFIENGRREKYYDGEDAILMLRLGSLEDRVPGMES